MFRKEVPEVLPGGDNLGVQLSAIESDIPSRFDNDQSPLNHTCLPQILTLTWKRRRVFLRERERERYATNNRKEWRRCVFYRTVVVENTFLSSIQDNSFRATNRIVPVVLNV